MTSDLDLWLSDSPRHYLGQVRRSSHWSKFRATGRKMSLKWTVRSRVRAFLVAPFTEYLIASIQAANWTVYHGVYYSIEWLFDCRSI